MIAVLVGFGTVWSPLPFWKITVFAGTPGSGSFRRCGAYDTGLPTCPDHSELSMNRWISMAPAIVLVRGGSLRSGKFSLMNTGEGALARPRAAAAWINKPRNTGLKRMISIVG